MKTAFVHDWLVGVAGGEKVLESLCELYEGPIYTLLKDHKALLNTPFAEKKIYSSFLQKLPKIEAYYRSLLPLFPRAIERLDLSSYQLIFSSSHAVAKGISRRPHQLHICYCHTPMRYVWDLQGFYLKQLNPIKRMVARPFLKYLRQWDHKTHQGVDHFIANSHHVAKRIEMSYGREAKVIYPPVDTHLFHISPKRESYYFTCSRLVAYKRVDILVKAFAQFPHKKLVVMGSGPELRRLKSKATKNIEFMGYQSNQILRETLSKAQAFLFAAEEDFGIVTVEAQAAGIPVIAYARGGSLETVLSGRTGIFFKEQTPASVIDAVNRFEKMKDDFEPEKIQQHAEQFSKARFQAEIKDFVAEKIAQHALPKLLHETQTQPI